jgi:DNA transposition AAA+ family ATPase
MKVQTVLKEDTKENNNSKLKLAVEKEPSVENERAPNEYNDALHERFLLWRDHSGNSINRIAGMLARSAAAISQYINKKYVGDLQKLERDVATLLRREEDYEFITRPKVFCNTLPAKLIWEVFQFCDKGCEMGLVVGPAGIGKTQTCNEYKRANPKSVLVTADIATRSVGTILRMIAKRVGSTPHGVGSNSALLHAIIDRMKHSRRLIIIDEAHFLTWEAFEVVRKIHDCAEIGIVYVGMERTYNQMKGTDNRAYLYDQIYSRISIKRNDIRIERDDVKTIAESISPGLGKDCIDYLFRKAQGKGKFRTVQKLLQVADTMRVEHKRPIDVEVLKMADQFLMV